MADDHGIIAVWGEGAASAVCQGRIVKGDAGLERERGDDGDMLVWDQGREGVLGLGLRSFLDVFSHCFSRGLQGRGARGFWRFFNLLTEFRRGVASGGGSMQAIGLRCVGHLQEEDEREKRTTFIELRGFESDSEDLYIYHLSHGYNWTFTSPAPPYKTFRNDVREGVSREQFMLIDNY